MRVHFIRHGSTNGNAQKRYIGRTDEALSDDGIKRILQLKERGCYPKTELVICSNLKRTRETAELIYGRSATVVVVEQLKECDFGAFEGKNYIELSGNAAYQKWIDSNGSLPFPGGEAIEDFQKRCVEAFVSCLERYAAYETITFCVHGGTIMAILSHFAEDAAHNQASGQGRTYYDYHCENGQCLSYEVCFGDKLCLKQG